jgi:hypothetical protein
MIAHGSRTKTFAGDDRGWSESSKRKVRGGCARRPRACLGFPLRDLRQQTPTANVRCQVQDCAPGIVSIHSASTSLSRASTLWYIPLSIPRHNWRFGVTARTGSASGEPS